MSGDLVRSFIAVELPEDVRAGIGKIQARLSQRILSSLGQEAADKALKWVDPQGVHLTLKFLGYVSAARLGQIEEALRRAASDKLGLAIEIGGLGAFPGLGRPRVIWIGVRGEVQELAKIQDQIDAELAGLGFPRETRAFSPHITLARLRETASSEESRKIGESVKADLATAPLAVRVDAISLMRSELTRAGARYSTIARLALRP